jgi:hypothetical protein
MANPTPQDVNTAIKYNARQRAIDDAKFIMSLKDYNGPLTPQALIEIATNIEAYYLNDVEVKPASTLFTPRSVK